MRSVTALTDEVIYLDYVIEQIVVTECGRGPHLETR